MAINDGYTINITNNIPSIDIDLGINFKFVK